MTLPMQLLINLLQAKTLPMELLINLFCAQTLSKYHEQHQHLHRK